MNPGGDAAEQVVRMSLEGVEVAAKISGQGAKIIAANLIAALKEEQKTKGRARLSSMLKSGKPLKVYEIQQKDLKKFAQEAKRYGVLYCILKDKNNENATVDVISRVEDASKIQRITERFKLAAIDTADVIGNIEKEKAFPAKDAQAEPEKTAEPAAERAGRIMQPAGKESEPANPTQARAEKDPLSGPSSKQTSRSNGSTRESGRPSVREKLAGYRRENERARSERAREKSKGFDIARQSGSAAVPKIPKHNEKGR